MEYDEYVDKWGRIYYLVVWLSSSSHRPLVMIDGLTNYTIVCMEFVGLPTLEQNKREEAGIS